MTGTKRRLTWVALGLGLGLAVLASSPNTLPAKEDETINNRFQSSGTVLREVLDVPENVPRGLLDKARCVIVFPALLKAAFVVGGEYGHGVMTCRGNSDMTGPWGAPIMMTIEGASLGYQIGGEATDLIIVVMNNQGADSLLRSKVKLGLDVSVAAGPKGRSAKADTDAIMKAEMLSYSRSRGVFAGISLEGSSLQPDDEANKALYGNAVLPKDIVSGSKVAIPQSAHTLLSVLQQASPHLRSTGPKKRPLFSWKDEQAV
ncbi:MAG TPA: lipid-binding SYLF domain-containing protein [Chthoniobacterales bacterium]|nr:lipid-binding SYLF domain-containing protein [Chthoniobacterales bacterium]